MKAAYLTGYGGSEVIEYGDLPNPELRAKHVIVGVRATGVNPVEIAMRAGEFAKFGKYKFPHIMGLDIAGVVSAVGPGVTAFKVGDDVCGILPGRQQGGYAEKAAISAQNLALNPRDLTFVQAASLPRGSALRCLRSASAVAKAWRPFLKRLTSRRPDAEICRQVPTQTRLRTPLVGAWSSEIIEVEIAK
jgi:NADPH:quinone reductase-like Zn-dependent oxidoreductase